MERLKLSCRDSGDKLCRIVSIHSSFFFTAQTRRRASPTKPDDVGPLRKMRGLGESKWHVGENEFLPPSSSSLTQLMMGVGCTGTMLLCGEPDRLQRSINVESNRRLFEPTRFCCRKLGALTLFNIKYEAKDFNILLNSVNTCSLL